MARELHVQVDGAFKMLAAWVRYREVFRAEWLADLGAAISHDVMGGRKPHMRIFLPFLSGQEWTAPRFEASRVLAMKDWLAMLSEGGQDDLDLRLHEVWHHGLMGRRDAAGVTGIGSNTMDVRARTTRPPERLEARKALLEAFDVVVFHGVPDAVPRYLRATP